MKKLAVFVEGQTEQRFVEQLLVEVAGRHNILITLAESRGGRKHRRKLIHLKGRVRGTSRSYFALVCDCGTDNRVASDIRDNYGSLMNQGYDAIIGVRDVYPDFRRSEIAQLERGLYHRIKTHPVRPLFVLAVMEIEAWFLAEHTHFERIHPCLTIERILSGVGVDLSTDAVEQRDCPSEDLRRIYQLAGLGYRKRKGQVERTVNALDFGVLYLETRHAVPHLGTLLDAIDDFLS